MRFLSQRNTIIATLGLLAAISLGAYLAASEWILQIGFPLDDAWIHQTYARNLGANGAWEFLPSQPSAGSTAPAWTLMLSFGYWLGLNKYIWTFLLGWLLLWASAVTAVYGFMKLEPKHALFGFFAGVAIIFEWHLTWAAGSGMETLLAALVALIVLLWVIRLSKQSGDLVDAQGWNWFGVGALIGFGVWVRPDGITLLGVAGLTLLLSKAKFSTKIKEGSWLVAGVLLLTLPYLIFNWVLAGDFWPNTFYAKQAEYAILRNSPLWQRFLNIIRQPLTGVGIILLPGFFWFGYRKLAEKAWAEFFSFVWIFGYFLLYALRLPVTYQHGRYVMPVIPALCLLGIAGMFELMDVISPRKWGRIVRPAWFLSAIVILFAFWILGLQAYAMDVAVIESEMVNTAKWVAESTEPDALVAAHDIGALGYYGDRNLIDLAGLISPEVIPFIRDETALERYIDEQDAEYLVTFPAWYPDLAQRGVIVYQTNQKYSPAMGGENMTVYRWNQQ